MARKKMLPIRYHFRNCMLVAIAALALSACGSGEVTRSDKKVLIINASNDSTPYNIANLMAAIGQVNSRTHIDTTNSLTGINEDSIKGYGAIILINVKVTQFKNRQQIDLQRYVQAGSGLGILSAKVSNKYYWSWFDRINTLVNQKDQNDQQYYDGGRVASLDTKTSVKDIISFLIGPNSYNYKKARTSRVPDPKRFVKKVLDNQVNEPMDLVVLPDGKVLFIEREGAIKLYNPETKSTKTIDKFIVNTEGNYEDGMLGITIDPLFEKNNWIYIYYSPIDTIQKQNLSRFMLIGDSLIRSTEKIVLEVLVQRETCCHSGGALVFDAAGNLYLSTGDNTSSKESDGYSPIDERPGRSPFDAQKSSSNTNDLRGKIIRITPTAEGSYTIPDGNLFPKNGSRGRPEIYLMGLRNPFRFTVDPITNFVYWGDVGPDSGRDSDLGPQSYDEFNQARGPGFYGWPYFVGDNKAYPKLDFATGKIGRYFDPKNPVNESPNNTGNKLLPSAQKPMIWYPYGKSKEFPMLGTGSRSALGGPIYYAHRYDNKSTVKFPDYFNGKWFIYDWARSWIMVVTMDSNHDLAKIESFLPGVTFDKPIDIEFGPEGAMYILEYGANYFTDNDDARLSKIEFNAYNTAPVAIARADKKVGAAPLRVNFTALESYDYDQEDSLHFEWVFNDPKATKATGPNASFVYELPGNYSASLNVTDSKGAITSSNLMVVVGNEKPTIDIQFDGNQSFYFDREIINYTVKVADIEDGSSDKGQIPAEDIGVHFNYLPHGKDLALLGPDQFSAPSLFVQGKNLLDNSDCKSCHSIDKKSIGPTYLNIAERYNSDNKTIDILGQKIIEGGNGNWGHSLMAAHPQLTKAETTEMVKYILSLTDDAETSSQLGLSGVVAISDNMNETDEDAYLFSVSYQDKGSDHAPPLTAHESIVLRNSKKQAEDYREIVDCIKERPNGGELSFVKTSKTNSYIAFHDIDLTAIKDITFQTRSNRSTSLSMKTGSANGEVIGHVTLDASEDNRWLATPMKIKSTAGIQDIYVVFEGGPEGEYWFLELDWLQFGN